VKTGRNDLCHCGSGKKYKHCCLGTPGDRESRGSAQVIADKIAEAAAEQPFESLEEINAFTAQLANERNQWALAEFCGLSPEQMTQVLYKPFDSPQAIQFSTDIEPSSDVRIMRIFRALVEAIGESGLKPTATGNLPLKFCKAFAQELSEGDDDDRNSYLRYGGIRSETDFEELHSTRLVAELAGLVRKYRGKFVLTRKCREMLAKQESGRLYFELFKAYATKFNWAYRDGYPEAEIVQRSFLYTLFLLTFFGDTEHSQQFYENKFITAFPMVLEAFPDTSYSSTEKQARRVYFLRALDRFAAFFGLAELGLESEELYRSRYVVRQTTLLDRFLTLTL
jgi:SEC-C motif-containing protein